MYIVLKSQRVKHFEIFTILYIYEKCRFSIFYRQKFVRWSRDSKHLSNFQKVFKNIRKNCQNFKHFC